MNNSYQLFGIPASLYMAKARSYLRKQHIPFVERTVGDPYFGQKIVPTVGRFIMPVLETPDGTIVQDGADIIDYFENQAKDKNEQTRLPALPENSVQRAVSYLFELFGGEGLLRPAMHYRWNFPDENLAFLKNEFTAGLLPSDADEEAKNTLFEFASGSMQKAKKFFGVTAECIPLVEESYAEFLRLFAEHLKASPFLLGGRPTYGDYGLIAPLYAHLSRDPYPGQQMRQHAPHVARWVERMNVPEQVIAEHSSVSEDLFADDAVPDTLKQLMRYVAEEYLPEIVAHVNYANDWLDERPDLEASTNGLEDPAVRAIGKAEFDWRGIRLRTAVMPYRFYLLQRLQDTVVAANDAEQQAIKALFAETGLSSILEVKTHRRVERNNYLEVWGEDRRASES